MTEMQRLLEVTSDELELELLGSAQDDAPGPGAKQQLLTSLGAAGGALSAAAGVQAASAASGSTPTAAASGAAQAAVGAAAAGTAASAATGTAVTGLAVAKWVGIGLVAGGAATGAVTAVTELASSPEPAQVTPALVATATEQQRDELRAAAARAQPPGAELGATEDQSVAGRNAPTVPPPPSSRVAEEVRLLDQTRESLRQGDSSEALRLLREHQARFGRGVLGEEAELLAIEARLERGQAARAHAMAQSFLRSHPTSPHQARVRTLLARAQAALRPKPGARAPEEQQPAEPEAAPPARTSSVASFPEP